MSNEKRIYTSKKRQTQAIRTRSRILCAAKKLFQSEGIEPVTIEKIAKAATVSIPTVYALFKSKRGILRAIIDEALPVEQFEALVQQANKAKSIKELFTISAKIARNIYDAERDQMETFWNISILIPEFKELEKEREKRRYERQKETLEKIAGQDIFAKELDIARTRDILWAFTGRDIYRLLVVEKGWTADEYETWLGQMLIKVVIE